MISVVKKKTKVSLYSGSNKKKECDGTLESARMQSEYKQFNDKPLNRTKHGLSWKLIEYRQNVINY